MKQVILIFSIAMLFVSCSSTKKKGETGKLGRFYHNVTAKYNGYFNANEILKESFVVLEESNDDNYDQILNLYPYQPSDPKSATAELDRAIEKVSTVVSLHRPSKWVDDCYLLLGKAQFLKQDYESAEETFRFFQEEFDPYSIYNAKYEKNKRESSKEKKKSREAERDIKRKELEEEKKETKEKRQEEKETKKQEREKKDKTRKDLKKKTDKLNDQIRDLKKDLKKAERKRREEIRKKEKEARKKKKRLPKKDPNADPRSSKEKQLQAKLDSKKAELDKLRNPQKEKIEEPKPVVQEETVVAENSPEQIEEEETKAKKKKKSTREIPGGGLFKHKPAYYEGILWLAMTYAERGNAFSSEYLLKTLEEEGVYKEIQEDIPAAYAHLYLKQKDYEKAIPALNRAIEKEDNKKAKARYAFILAQIYESKNNYSEALKYYSQVDNYKPSFLMDFNAKLKKIKLSHATDKTSKESALKSLDKLLKEAKYEDFKSQLYFAKGELELENNNIAEAIGFFQKSLSEPGSSNLQQANVYYSLASIFYEQEKYFSSSTYYDSTLIVLDKKDDRYLEVEKRARNLKDIALNIEIITEQDSLLRLASLSRDELKELAEQVEKENKEKGVTNTKSKSARSERKTNTGNRRAGGSSSSFFAYNNLALVQGQSDFRRKWGERALEDNWRRSNRTNASEIDDFEVVEEEAKSDFSDEQIRKILGDIPFSPQQKRTANNKIADAMYDLGIKYRDNLESYEKSTETLEELLRRFPDYEKRLDAYYYLYLSYNDLNQSRAAQVYATKITSEFPESDYAKIISDPNYLNKLIADGGSLERTYKDVYALFESEQYAQAKAKIDQAKIELESSNPYAAKFGLLDAMCIGSMEGKDAYVKALRDVTTRYPNTPEKTRAQEIMRFLRGEGDAFSELIYEEEKDVFKLEDKKLHYNILVVYDISNKEMNDLKVALSNYNKKYHKSDRLKVASIFLNREDESQIVLIRRFKDKSKAMQYYVTALSRSDELTNGLDIDYTMYSVTQRNYREIIKQKSEKAYRAFYEKNYLNQ